MIDSGPGTLLRLAAFTTDPAGGNPAGVWIGEQLPPDAEMQRIAAEVGYSETAFLAPDRPAIAGHFRVRYFSPLAEVPFCGHATIASGVVLAEHGLGAGAIVLPLSRTCNTSEPASHGVRRGSALSSTDRPRRGGSRRWLPRTLNTGSTLRARATGSTPPIPRRRVGSTSVR